MRAEEDKDDIMVRKGKKPDIRLFTCSAVPSTHRQGGKYFVNGKWVYRMGDEMIPVALRDCISDWVEQAKVTGQYPPAGVEETLGNLLGNTYVRRDERFGGDGLFAGRFIKKGDLIGICTGKVNEQVNEYSMTIRDIIIDGSPIEGQGRFKMSKINDWIWDEDGCNAIHKDGGVILAKGDINAGDQIFMSYSESYNWDREKLGLLQDVPGILRRTLEGQGKAGHFEKELTELERDIGEWDDGWALQSRGHALEFVLWSLTIKIEVERCHWIRPSAEKGFGEWVIGMVLCTPFRERFGF
jgi:hypothetical protein